MFKGTYTDRFYRAVRDALHEEVESWKPGTKQSQHAQLSADLWKMVESLEPASKNADPTELPEIVNSRERRMFSPGAPFVPLRAVATGRGELNE
jgi:hypothetical protein